MWIFISFIVINNSFWYSPINFFDIEIIAVVFRAFIAIQYVFPMFKCCLIFDLKPRWKFSSLISYHNYDVFYNGEADRWISDRIIDHNKRDKNSQPLQDVQNEKHTHVWMNHLKYQRESLITIREIKIRSLYKMHKIRNTHMFG